MSIIIANIYGTPTKPCAEYVTWTVLFSPQDNYQEGIYREGRFSESRGRGKAGQILPTLSPKC